MGTVVEVLDTQSLDHKKYTSHFDSPILSAEFDTVARGYLEDYARSLKMQFQDHPQRDHYDALSADRKVPAPLTPSPSPTG